MPPSVLSAPTTGTSTSTWAKRKNSRRLLSKPSQHVLLTRSLRAYSALGVYLTQFSRQL